ncbi:MAG: protein-disulfide reductase DsbD domain-containing protein [Bdellovibrionales bacterium]
MFLVFLFALPGLACAGASDWVEVDNIRARLMTGEETDKGIEAALEVNLQEGWHSYWRVPGDAGLPPEFDWSGSDNIKDVQIFWPVPKRKKEIIFNTFGYDDAVLFPLEITREANDKAATADLALDIMICKDICIPQHLDLSLDIPPDSAAEAAHISAIKTARDALPKDNGHNGLIIQSAVIGADALVVNVTAENGLAENLDLLPDAGEVLLTSPPEVIIAQDTPNKAMIKIPKGEDTDNLSHALAGKTLSLILINGDHAVEKIIEY